MTNTAILTIATIACAGAAIAAVIAWYRARRDRDLRAADAAELRADLRAIMASLSSGLLIVDAHGVVRTAGRAAARIFGRDLRELVGAELNEALDDGWHGFTRRVMQVITREESVERAEVEVQRDDGRKLPVGVTVDPVYGPDGELVGAVAVFQDLTEVMSLRDRMRETDRLAAIGELSASIAHEIRNPLGSIRGSAEILTAELDLSGQERRLLELILKESGRVNGLIGDFLGYARLRPTRPQITPAMPLLEDVAHQAEASVGVGSLRTRIVCDIDPPDLVLALDEEQMRQVLLNLILNAQAVMSEGGLIEVACRLDLAAGRCLMTVADEGPGLPADLGDEIFKPFVSTRRGGTGLGLATVQRIVHAHGGVVHAADRPDGGAVFTLELPLPGTSLTTDEPLDVEHDVACLVD